MPRRPHRRTRPLVLPEVPVPLPEELPEEAPAPTLPPDWREGMLLNVRNIGAGYAVTLYPEEADPRAPERTLHFRNPAECQDFVSRWYGRQSPDPRAR